MTKAWSWVITDGMYAGDSFFTLSAAGQTGLALLSATLALLALWICWRVSHRRPVPVRLVLAALVFAGFVWLTPQIYYAYYLSLFEDLHFQLVIGWPPSPVELLSTLFFQERFNLSYHARGLLGWALLAVALFAHGAAEDRVR